MFPWVHLDGRCAALRPHDIARITAYYPEPARQGDPLIVSSLPNAGTETPYLAELEVAGGIPPFAWSFAAGSDRLPAGLALRADGVIAGRAAAPGLFSFNVQVTDAAGRAAQRELSIAVELTLPSVAATALRPAVVGVVYDATVETVGGVAPFAFALEAGSLPEGISLGAESGRLSGTPAAKGTSPFRIVVRDAFGRDAAVDLRLDVFSPADLPRIDSARYRNPGKLTLSGANFGPTAVVLVDGQTVVPATARAKRLVVKRLRLAPGDHEVRVMLANGLTSTPVILAVR
jgi:hypothetical protein